MSANPEDLQPSNVTEMTTWLQATYDEILTLDKYLHKLRDEVKGRLYALHAAQNPQIAKRLDQYTSLVESGDEPEGLTSDEILSAFQPQAR